MSKKLRLAIYSLFFFSGLAGLLYEIVWGRQLVLIFGNTTHSLVAVLAAFFTGLALGSLVIGKIIDHIPDNFLFKTYALFELGVGILSGASLILFPTIKSLYATLSDGTTISPQLLLIKFALTILVITLPTFCMGATLPILVRVLRGQPRHDETVSRLYAINTFGGVLGVFLTGFILLELFGLTKTIEIGVAINCGIALIAYFLTPPKITKREKTAKVVLLSADPSRPFVYGAFFCSGFIGIAYQVMWTRLLIPSLGTLTYAFSAIVIINLFGIALGSLLYKKATTVITGKYLLVGLCQIGISLGITLPILITHFLPLYASEVLIRVLPATFCMGIAFPALIGIIKHPQDIGNAIGKSYAINTLGSIIGGFVTSFVLIPYLGTISSLVLLALSNLILAYSFLRKEISYAAKIKRGFLSFNFICVLGTLILFLLARQNLLLPLPIYLLQQAAHATHAQFKLKEDEVASVTGYNDGTHEALLIDGYPTTSDTLETRVMAHLPIALHVGKPKRVLIICFGMGTSFRSFLKYNLSVDAVELVPSVPTFMSLFHQDAAKWQHSSKGTIIINDGRNYAFLTHEKYDIIIIDPPPPFFTAGSSVLYTEEFYQDLKRHLTPNGIVSQWLYYENTRNDDALMAVKSVTNSFTTVAAFRLHDSAPGIFLVGTQGSLSLATLANATQNPIAKNDLAEISSPKTTPIVNLIATKPQLLPLVANSHAITDDHPGNEYFLLRHLFSHQQSLTSHAVNQLFLRK